MGQNDVIKRFLFCGPVQPDGDAVNLGPKSRLPAAPQDYFVCQVCLYNFNCDLGFICNVCGAREIMNK